MSEIVLSSIDFSFDRDTPLFRDFSLTFASGRTTAIMGPSGCGKTTLLRLGSGLVKPHKGQVMAGERVVQPGSIRGVVFHEDTLLPWLNIERNVCFHAPRDQKIKEEAQRLLVWVGLGSWRNRYPFELSAGMRKRAEFARALVADKHFLLLDEPFSSLDLITKMRIWKDWSRQLLEAKRTKILATHDPFEAATIADSVVILTRTRPVRIEGRLEFHAESGSVETRASCIQSMLCRAVEG